MANIFFLALLVICSQFEMGFSTESTSNPEEKKKFVMINELRWDQGMFSALFTVADYLDNYEKGLYSGVEIVLGTEGLYYDSSQGPNWWGYYFEPLKAGVKEGHDIEYSSKDTAHHLAYSADQTIPRQRIGELTKKYIKIKTDVQQKVDTFVDSHFKDRFVIGIHYRGTDKHREARLVPYEKTAEMIKKYGKDNQIEDYIIFVATDEQKFLDFIREAFPNKIVYLEHFRSTDGKPIHLEKPSPYLHGQEALIDCLVLSKCNALIRTSSNLGAWSTFFNPNIPVMEIWH